MQKKLMLIDGHSMLNRAFYAVPLLTNKEGHYTNAIYGFFNIFFKFIDEEQPDFVAVTFDLPKPTFRHLKFSEYKGTRKKMPEELRQQVPILKQFLEKMNIKIYEKAGFEADDVLGTIAKKAESINIYTTIISGDKDLLQLASDKIKIKIPKTKNGKTEVDSYFKETVFEKYGVSPEEFIEVKALMGDKSDNVPGVTGIGEKTAIKIIKEFKTVENAIKNAQNIKPNKISQNLINEQEKALLSKYLVTIEINVPIDFLPEDLSFKNMFNEDSYKMFKQYEFKSFLSKFNSIRENKKNEEINLEIITSFDDAKTYINKILNQKQKEIAYNPLIENNKLIGICICFEKNNVTLLKTEGNFNEQKLVEIIKPFLEKDYKKITHNAKEQIVFFYNLNINIQNIVFDTMIAAYILDATKQNYDYNDLAQEFLNLDYPTLEDIFGKGKNKKSMLELDSKIFKKFCYNQTITTFNSKNIMAEKIKENDQNYLYYEIELPLIYVLAYMEIFGIYVDEKDLKDYKTQLEERIDNLTNEIYWLSGEEFNINSPKQLSVILFEKLGLKGGKKTKTGWSTSADVLEKLKDKNEIINKILEYRTYSKLKSTYTDGLLNVVDKKTCKIHSNFKQTITATGRISSTEPNLQNIPIKTEFGKKFRKVFKPKTDDFVFIDADYSQIELRVLAHMSKDQNLINAFKNKEDIHKITASQIFDISLDHVTPFQRSAAKAINFGIIYGKQAYTLSQDLNISKKDAEKYINDYFEKYPNVKLFLDNIINDAKKYGYTKTVYNRIRNIKEIKSADAIRRNAAERMAMNMPIQGTAADIIKIAMVKVFNRIKKENLKSKLILQVHDELLIEAHKDEVEQVKNILKQEMENTVSFLVPLEIDINLGKNWYEAK